MIDDLPDGAGLAATDAATCARPWCCIRIQQSLRGMVMVVIEVTLVLVRMVLMAMVVTLAVMMIIASLGKLIVLA